MLTLTNKPNFRKFCVSKRLLGELEILKATLRENRCRHRQLYKCALVGLS